MRVDVEVELICLTRLRPGADDQALRLDTAPLHTAISDDLLAELAAKGWAGEGLFMVKGENATVRYMLTEYDPDLRGWYARRIGPNPLSAA